MSEPGTRTGLGAEPQVLEEAGVAASGGPSGARTGFRTPGRRSGGTLRSRLGLVQGVARTHIVVGFLVFGSLAAMAVALAGMLTRSLPPYGQIALPTLSATLALLSLVAVLCPQRLERVVLVAIMAFVTHLVGNAFFKLTDVPAAQQLAELGSIAIWNPVLYTGFFLINRPRTAAIATVCSLVLLTAGMVAPLQFGDPVHGSSLAFTAVSNILSHLVAIPLIAGLGLMRSRHSSTQRAVLRLSRDAETDLLTQLANRRGMVPAMEVELQRLAASVDHPPATLTLMDIDHFKRINDTHGHSVGDAVLRELGGLLRTHSRPTDLPGRWGGEEFVILSQCSTLAQARAHARTLRNEMHARKWPAGIEVRASFGIAQLIGGEPIDSAIQRADAALAIAKSGGRDRVESIEADPTD